MGGLPVGNGYTIELANPLNNSDVSDHAFSMPGQVLKSCVFLPMPL